eukprot:2672729-Pleurochrysis_carterae.AAC.1
MEDLRHSPTARRRARTVRVPQPGHRSACYVFVVLNGRGEHAVGDSSALVLGLRLTPRAVSVPVLAPAMATKAKLRGPHAVEGGGRRCLAGRRASGRGRFF